MGHGAAPARRPRRSPGGESLAGCSARVIAAVRRIDAAIEAEHGPAPSGSRSATATRSRRCVADALGMHLDHFQRIVVDPASISVVRYTADRPFVLATNTHEGDLGWLTAAHQGPARVVRRTRRSVGGAGPRVAESRVDDMAPLVHGFDPPERFVAGTVGPPGQRTFFLQAREGVRVVSVALEKQQVRCSPSASTTCSTS